MPDTVSACPLCSANASRLFDQREFRGQTVTNRICQRCGLVYQSPRMTVEENQSFYEAEYRRLYQGQEGPIAKDLAVQTARARVTLDYIQPRVTSAQNILDIGCSSGIWLKLLSDHYHATGYGIEPGTSYRHYAQAMGLSVFPSLADLKQNKPPAFDLISMMHVLEHVPDPVEYLRHLHENYLAPGGTLLVEVPNLYTHDSFEVAHLTSFSAHSLVQIIQKAGFRPIHLRTHGKPRSWLLPLYITLLAKPDADHLYTLKPERFVRLKRKTGFSYRFVIERLFPQRAWISPDSLTT